MYTAPEIIAMLENTNSKNEKIEILKKHANNGELIKTLKAALDPHVQFYVFQIPEYQHDTLAEQIPSVTVALKQLKRLTTRAVTGNAARELLAKVLSTCPPDVADVVTRVVQKDLRCGVGAKLVNKAIPGLIPEFPCMLCMPYSEKNLERIHFPAIVQTKMDGARTSLVCVDGTVHAFTRNGKAIELHGVLDDEVRTLLSATGGKNYVLDGELLVLDNKGKILPRKKGNGIVNKAVKGTIARQEAENFVFVVWDIIPHADWTNGKSLVPYRDRFEFLVKEIRKHDLEKIMLVKSQYVNSREEALQFYLRQITAGEEGAIIKNVDAGWVNKRSPDQVKMKVEEEVDLRVVAINEGTGKNVGKLGALTVETSDSVLRVNVGSGFSDAQRKEFFTEDLIGKIVTVKANGVITSESKKEYSLFLPTFVELREDKNEAESFFDVSSKFTNPLDRCGI